MRTEAYTENREARYRLPNLTTMGKLSMQVSAGEGAVVKYSDKVYSSLIMPGRDLSLRFTSSSKPRTRSTTASVNAG